MDALVPESIETERLRLEALTVDDTDVREFYGAFAEDSDLEVVMEYVPQSPFHTPGDAVEMLESIEQRRDNREGYTYVVRPGAGEDGAGEIAGTTSIWPAWDRHCAALGIVLRRRFWGRGYSGERAEAMVELAFDRLDLDVVAVTCVTENDRSRRAIETYVERFGGQYDGTFRALRRMNDRLVDMHCFTVTAEQYAATTAEGGA